MLRSISIILFLAFCSEQVRGQIFDERFEIWPTDLKSPGTICFGDSISTEQLKSIFPGETTYKTVLLTRATGQAKEAIVARYSDFGKPLSVYTPTDWVKANDNESEVCIWHEEPDSVQRDQYPDATFRMALIEHLKRGSTLIAIDQAARLLSRFYVSDVEQRVPRISEGIHLLPDCVVETQFGTVETEYAGKRVGQPQLLSVLTANPRCVGVGLESGTVAILRGRKIRVVGKGAATFLLAANERQPIRLHPIVEAFESRRDSDLLLVDLTEWRRDAIDRTLEVFPPAQRENPNLDSGTLFIVGGGGMPQGLMDQFIEAAGGVENARLVYVPCDENDQVAPNSGMISLWGKMGVKQTALLHTKDRVQANEDDTFLKPLNDATGIWFGGGRQWNLADSYYGTKAHRLMKAVLQRGGVVGGSSAGASIQAAYLARATPIENYRIMAPGYERGGLGFLRGIAIDQHFSQRKRQPDMTQLVNRYPQLLGIGIDESTAIVVQGSMAKVQGNGKVHFYDRTRPVYPDQPDFIALVDGQRYHLVDRNVIEQ